MFKNILFLLVALFALDVMRKKFGLNDKEINAPNVKEIFNKEIEKNINISLNETAHQHQDKDQDYSLENENEIPSTSSLDKIYLDISYCTTTYSKQYEDLRKDLLGNYTNIEVRGSEYPIHPAKKILSKAASFLQMFLIVVIVGGQYVRNYLTFIPQAVFNFIDEKKVMIGILNFFVMGQITNALNSSGAFEVILNGENIWSKLDMKVLPTASDLVSILNYKGLNME